MIKDIEEYIKKGMIFHAHELEEFLLLKCPYYWKKSMDTVNSLTKCQWHLPQKQNLKLKEDFKRAT